MATSSRRRAPRSRRRRSDLSARIWVAIPAVAFAIFIVAAGDAVFAAGAVLLGFICIHELFRMYDVLHPVRLAGFVGVAGLGAAAHFGGVHQVLFATVAIFPLLFLLALAMPEQTEVPLTDSMAITLLGTLWIGLAIAHAVLLRALEHGGGLVLAVLLGTFVGDTAAYLGGRAFGTRPLAPRISPNKTVEGLAVRDRRRGAGGLVVRAELGVDGRREGDPARPRRRRARADRRPVRVARSSATRERRTPGRCSGRTAERSTGSTPRCSPLSAGTTSGYCSYDRRPQGESASRTGRCSSCSTSCASRCPACRSCSRSCSPWRSRTASTG